MYNKLVFGYVRSNKTKDGETVCICMKQNTDNDEWAVETRVGTAHGVAFHSFSFLACLQQMAVEIEELSNGNSCWESLK
jgi:hypothetical protein